MSIILNDGIKLNAPKPIDSRYVIGIGNVYLHKEDIPQSERYEGLLVFVLDEKTRYELIGGILDTNWIVFSGYMSDGSILTDLVINNADNESTVLVPGTFVNSSLQVYVNGIYIRDDLYTIDYTSPASIATGSLIFSFLLEIGDEVDLVKIFGSTAISGVATANHNDLIGRSLADQHPIGAIAGLEDALNNKENYLSSPTTVNRFLTSSTGATPARSWISISHDIITNRDADDSHPINAITGLSDELGAKIPLSQKGAASGVVPLDSLGKINDIYLPSTAINEGLIKVQSSLTPGTTGWVLHGFNQSTNGVPGFNSVNLQYSNGYKLPGALGAYSFVANTNNWANASHASAFGYNTQANGTRAFSIGQFAQAEGSDSFCGGQGYNDTSGHPRAGGIGSFTFQRVYYNRGFLGSTAPYSAVLGGAQNDIDVDAKHSAIIGGTSNRIASTGVGAVVLGGFTSDTVVIIQQTAVQPNMVYLMGNKYYGYTTAKREALPYVEAGTVVYDSDLQSLMYYNGTKWQGWILDTAVQWKGIWGEGTYYKDNMVRDGNWTMIANKETTDRAAPIIDSAIHYPTGDFASTGYTATTVTTGNKYLINHDIVIGNIKAFAPQVAADSIFTVILRIYDVTPDDGSFRSYNNIPISAGVVVTYSIPPTFAKAGQTVEVGLMAVNSSTSVSWEHNYIFTGKTSSHVSIGECNLNPNNTLFRISFYSENGSYVATDINNVTVGTILTLTSVAIPTNYVQYTVTELRDDNIDNTSFVVFQSGVGGDDLEDDEEVVVHADIPIEGGNDYAYETDWWVANTPGWIDTVEGQLYFGSTLQSGQENNAFGVDIGAQSISIPTDWDIVAFSGSLQDDDVSSSINDYKYTKVTDVIVDALNPAYENVATLDVTVPAGPVTVEYKFTFTFTLDSTNRSAYFRFSIDGGTNWSEFEKEPKDAADAIPFTYLFPITYNYTADTPTTILLDAGKDQAGDVLTMHFADIIYERKL